MSAPLATVNRTLRILEAFTYAEPVLGVSELARKVGMGKSTVHRALGTLRESGYVAQNADGRYRLGWKLHEMGQLVVSGMRLHEVAHDPLEKLRRDCDLAVNLVVLDGTEAIYIEQFESAGLARNFRESGLRAPAHTTSSGKCLLAFAEPDVINAVVTTLAEGKGGPRAISSEAALRAVLAEIRDKGFVVSEAERTKGITSIGAPVFGRDGNCIAAVSIVGPSLTFQDDVLERYVRMVRSCSLRIGRGMGGTGMARAKV
jgi:IclR family transcriptional regulator, KDG regulon repressor